MITSETALKTTALFEEHAALGAKMAPFAGYNMPIQYEGIIAETLHTRKAASCFDTCHMGEFLIKGDCKKSGLDKIVTARLDDLTPGSCRYASMLNAEGGVLDDLLVYRKEQEEWFIVVNAACVEKDKKNFLGHLGKNAAFLDLSEQLGKLDLQGPLARDILKNVAPGAHALKYYSFIETDILGERGLVSRTGYTGELGFEIYASAGVIRRAWKMLLQDTRVKPAGLGARDILRLEMGYSLYGQDIDETTTPLEAGLGKFIDFEKDFIGKEALLKQKKNGLRRTRAFFKTLSRRSPRHGHKIYSEGEEIGAVTSGTFSPHLGCGIGMGFAASACAPNQGIAVGDEALKIEAVFASKPFIAKTSLR